MKTSAPLARSALLASLLILPFAAQAAGRPLETLLLAFAHRKDEKAMQALPGILWKGVSYPADSERDNAVSYLLHGSLVLSGFGAVQVPVGIGANQTTKTINEGETSLEIRFSSSNNPALRGPYHILLSKHYPSPDSAAILRREITGGALVLLADHCTKDTLGRTIEGDAAYYRIDLPDAPTAVFVRTGRNVDGGNSGPGETTYAFTLFTPGKDLMTSGCTLFRPTP